MVQAHEEDAAAIYIIPCASCAEGVWIGAIVVYGILEATEEFAARIGRMLPLLVKRLPDRTTGNRRTRGTEECCNKKEATFLSNRLVNAGCIVESGHRRCAKARANPPHPELPGVKLTSGRTLDDRTQNRNIQELARCGRQLAYEVGLALKVLIPEVYRWHTTPTESSCRIDPEDKRGNGGADERVGRCFSACSILADVATHPHKDRGNRPGTASAMAILKSDTGAGAQHHFIQGYSISVNRQGRRQKSSCSSTRETCSLRTVVIYTMVRPRPPMGQASPAWGLPTICHIIWRRRTTPSARSNVRPRERPEERTGKSLNGAAPGGPAANQQPPPIPRPVLQGRDGRTKEPKSGRSKGEEPQHQHGTDFLPIHDLCLNRNKARWP